MQRKTQVIDAPFNRSRRPDCPDEAAIATYVDGILRPEQAEQASQHLVDCEDCRTLVGVLVHEPRQQTGDVPPQNLIERAEDLVRVPVPATPRWKYYRWATAASVALLAPLLIMQLERSHFVDTATSTYR